MNHNNFIEAAIATRDQMVMFYSLLQWIAKALQLQFQILAAPIICVSIGIGS